MNLVEFPHSEIPGSKDVCSSPRLIAAYHVFHRLPVPRHSPCALYSLTVSCSRFSICQQEIFTAGEIIDFLNFTRDNSFSTIVNLSFRSSIFSFQGTYRIRLHRKACLAPFRCRPPFNVCRTFVLHAMLLKFFLSKKLRSIGWWAEMDSNHRPLGYQPSALTS